MAFEELIGILWSNEYNKDEINDRFNIIQRYVYETNDSFTEIEAAIVAINIVLNSIEDDLNIIIPETNKIDNAVTLGMSGVNNSLAYRVHEIEKHFHSAERWLGVSADQTGSNWALENTLNSYQAISGNGVFGADANDEAKVIGIDDGKYTSDDMVKFDLHRFFFEEISADNPFIIRIVWGTGTMADAIANNCFSTFMVQNNPTGNKAGGVPVDIMMPRKTWGTDQVWVQTKSATDDATVDFFVGVHEYIG